MFNRLLESGDVIISRTSASERRSLSTKKSLLPEVIEMRETSKIAEPLMPIRELFSDSDEDSDTVDKNILDKSVGESNIINESDEEDHEKVIDDQEEEAEKTQDININDVDEVPQIFFSTVNFYSKKSLARK